MLSKYDVIVVGAGPAGSVAAKYAAQSGASVLLLEKDRQVGLPVRCAEGVGEKGMLASLENIDPRWISQEINGVTFVAPNGEKVELATDKGYILDRKVFDADLAKIATDHGATVVTKAFVDGLIVKDAKVCGVTLQHLGQKKSVQADIVIGADGLESRVGRWAGIDTHCAMDDMESGAQVTACGIDVNERHIHLYFGNDLAPHGYFWIFPKGNGVANVGLAVSGPDAKIKKPIDYLNEFMQTNFPQASVLTTVFGGVPCDKTLDQITADGLMLVGDAAHQVNPISGGGINTGMFAGKCAGIVAGNAVKEKDFTAKRFKEYEKMWHKREGRNNKICYNLKDYVFDFSDEQFNNIAHGALHVPFEKRTLMSVFKVALKEKPSLILEAVKVFT